MPLVGHGAADRKAAPKTRDKHRQTCEQFSDSCPKQFSDSSGEH